MAFSWTPAARGQGVGTALLKAIIAEGRRRGYAEVRLDVIDTNPRATALYERIGFGQQTPEISARCAICSGFTQRHTMVPLRV